MGRPKANFRITDIPRAFKGLRLAGVARPQVEYVLPDGTRLILSEAPEAPPAAPAGDDEGIKELL